jgi:hypothetical protein
LAKASEQFRQSDVTLWGVVALLCAGLAVFGSNVALLAPQSVIGGLHQPRIAGASIETLRQQVVDLRQATNQLRRDNEQLLARFAIQEQAGSETIRRVGALEITVPQILEAMPARTGVDRGNVTASIGSGETTTFEADGGSVAVRRVPLPGLASVSAVDQPLPAPIEQASVTPVAPAPYGVAIGAAVAPDGTEALWDDLTLKLGPLLFGLTPLVSNAEDRSSRVVVGPISGLTEARDLCQRFERVAIACTPAPYIGEPLETPANPVQGG